MASALCSRVPRSRLPQKSAVTRPISAKVPLIHDPFMKTILVPIDFSDVTPRVLDAARELAGAFAAKIVLLHVSEPEPDFVGFEPGPIAVRATIARDFKKEHQQLDAART